MRAFILIGLLFVAGAVRAFPDDLQEELSQEIKQQEPHVDRNRTISELASEFISETRKLGEEVMGFLNQAVNDTKPTRQARGFFDDSESEGIDVSALISAINKLSGVEARAARADEPTPVAAAPAAGPAPVADTKSDSDKKPEDKYTAPTTESSYQDSYKKKKKAGGVIIAPKPILVPIPGKPGLPGPPGPPGLPGLPGKTPNLRGLKAILLAKIAKLWLLAKAVALLCLLKFGGNLALILGLVLPLYGKLKKAGVVLPVHETYEEQPTYNTYEAASYGPPAPAYGPPAPAYGAPAPYSDNSIAPLYNQVQTAVDNGKSAYDAPAPTSYSAPAPHRRRRYAQVFRPPIIIG